MTIPDAVVAMVVAALPDATLWEQDDTPPPTNQLLVFDGLVPPTPPDRYVVVWADDGHRTPGPGPDDANVADRSTSSVVRWQVTCVAPDRQMAAWLAGRVRDGLVDASPTVEGWSAGLIRHDDSRRPERDEKILARPVVYAVDLYHLLAERVPLPVES